MNCSGYFHNQHLGIVSTSPPLKISDSLFLSFLSLIFIKKHEYKELFLFFKIDNKVLGMDTRPWWDNKE